MAQSSLQSVLNFARRIAEGSEAVQASDRELLEHFRLHNDHYSFAALIERHGGMVWASCRRVLDCSQDAEDCFQAAFLVLARKAGTLKRGESLGGWLHRVAYRLALRCQSAHGRRRQKEGGAAAMKSATSESDPTWNELRVLLDRELEQLPQTYRVPLVLCYLEGKSNSQAARELGWPIGTLKGRLVRGKHLLRQRLEKRGLTLGSVALVALLSEQVAQAGVPGILMSATTSAAAAFALGKPASASAGALSLANGFLRAASLGTLLKSAVLLVGLTLATSGSALLAQPAWSTRDNEGVPKAPSEVVLARPIIAPKKAPNRLDAFGDPLPPDAISRLGSVRYRLIYPVRALVVTPDGKQIISEEPSGNRYFDLANGRLIKELVWAAAPGWHQGRAFSPDRKRYVAAGDRQLGIYDSETGTKIATLGEGYYGHACYSYDGKKIVAESTSEFSSVQLFDAHTGGRLWSSGHFDYGLSNLKFTPDDKSVIAAGWGQARTPPLQGNSVRVLDALSGKERLKIDLAESQPYGIAVSSDSKFVAVNALRSSNDMTDVMSSIRVWDLANGTEKIQIEPPLPPSKINSKRSFSSLLFSSTENALITGGGSCDELIVWDLATGKELKRLGQRIGNVSSLLETPDKKALVVAGQQRIHVIDLASGTDRTSPFESGARAFVTSLSNDGQSVFTALPPQINGSSEVIHWEAKSGKLLKKMAVPNGQARQLARDGTVALVEEAEKPHHVSLRNLERATEKALPAEITTPGTGAYAISDGGDLVAIGDSQEADIKVYDGKTGSLVRKLTDPELPCYRLRFTADQKQLLAFSQDQTVRIWSLETGKKVSQYVPKRVPDNRPRITAPPPSAPNSHEHPFFEIALSPDGKRIASTDLREYLFLRDAFDGKNQTRVDTGKERPRIMTFSPDSKLLAWASWDDPSLHILDVASQKEVRALTGHKGLILAMEFSKDGKKLLTSSTDGTALVWDFQRISAGIR